MDQAPTPPFNSRKLWRIRFRPDFPGDRQALNCQPPTRQLHSSSPQLPRHHQQPTLLTMASSQALPPLPLPNWAVELNSPPPKSRSANSIPDPPGFSRKAGGKGVRISYNPSKNLGISRGKQYSNSVLHPALRKIHPRGPVEARRNRHTEAQKKPGKSPLPHQSKSL